MGRGVSSTVPCTACFLFGVVLNWLSVRRMVWYIKRYGIVGFNVPLDTYRSFRGRFYGSDEVCPSSQQCVTALKDDGLSTTSRANPTRLSSLKGKEKDVSKRN